MGCRITNIIIIDISSRYRLRKHIASLSAVYCLYRGECSEELFDLTPSFPIHNRITFVGIWTGFDFVTIFLLNYDIVSFKHNVIRCILCWSA